MTRILVLLFVLICAIPSALAAVDVNTANQSELETLPGIGPSKASAIIDYRTQNGAFTDVEQLDNVPGIGPSTMANLRPLVTLGEGVVAPAASPSDGTSSDAASSATSTAPPANQVNINTASATELDALPGIGPSKASAIVEDRDANGPFSSCADLSRVKGIGQATTATIGNLCTTGSAAQ